MTKAQKQKLDEELTTKNYYDGLSLEKVRIENKNLNRNLTRVMNHSRRQQEELSDRQAELTKAHEERVKQQEKLAFQLNQIKNEELKELKMRLESVRL